MLQLIILFEIPRIVKPFSPSSTFKTIKINEKQNLLIFFIIKNLPSEWQRLVKKMRVKNEISKM